MYQTSGIKISHNLSCLDFKMIGKLFIIQLVLELVKVKIFRTLYLTHQVFLSLMYKKYSVHIVNCSTETNAHNTVGCRLHRRHIVLCGI